jgi:hypothetical protein
MSGIVDIVASNTVSRGQLPALEANLKEQVAKETYNFAANKLLIKHYQFFIDVVDTECVALALAKSLMNAAAAPTDFLLLSYLISDAVLKSEPVASIMRVGECIETCKFEEMWKIVGENKAAFDLPGFQISLRSYVVAVFSITFQTASEASLAKAMNIEVSALGEALKPYMGKTVASVADNYVSFVENDNNRDGKKVVQNDEAGINFSQGMGVFASSS